MPLSGICDVCRNVSHTLSVCPYCGSRVCVNCINPRTGACKRCQARIMRK